MTSAPACFVRWRAKLRRTWSAIRRAAGGTPGKAKEEEEQEEEAILRSSSSGVGEGWRRWCCRGRTSRVRASESDDVLERGDPGLRTCC